MKGYQLRILFNNSIVLIIVSLLVFSGCGNDAPKLKLPVGDKVEDIPNLVMEGFDMSSTENGVKQWELYAEGAQIFDMKKKAYAQVVTMKGYEGRGVVTVMTSERAIIDTDTNFIEATGNVRVKSSNGTLLLTSKLFWDDQKKRMHSDRKVTVIKGKNILKGTGFESDMHMRDLQLKEKVEFKARGITNE